MFIFTKEEDENVKKFKTDGLTDDGQQAIELSAQVS